MSSQYDTGGYGSPDRSRGRRGGTTEAERGWFESQTIPFSAMEWTMIKNATKGMQSKRDKNPGPHMEWLGIGGAKGTSIGERLNILISDFDPTNPRSTYIQCNTRSKPIPGKLRWRAEAAQADVPRVIVKQPGDRGKKEKDIYIEGQRQKRRYRDRVSTR